MGLQLRSFGSVMKAGRAILFPPQCLDCGAGVAEDGALCPDCWREAEFIGACHCECCGIPLPGDGGEEAGLACDECLSVARPWDRGRAAVVYAGSGRRLVLALKHGDRPDLAPSLGRWLAAAAGPLLRPDMLVVPVPLHPRRMMARKYNQSALLAAAVARAHGLRLEAAALRRTRHTPMQDYGSVADRFANVEGAVEVAARVRLRLEGRPVLLIDDVMASGATLGAAASALAAAGAGPVSVAVLARAVKGGSASASQAA
ncbi:double zinc ribbon domain-containing protein [Paracoccus sp. MC1854]|uniref:double zinc ribbon domain-containing protein n=1 Tax=Paracoccus sp. MC1854 TaxID=2760306 RepID=UPI002102CA2F|nr:double zinc ribbon domain-containing protein [Paracoccus sp. MC1854]